MKVLTDKRLLPLRIFTADKRICDVGTDHAAPRIDLRGAERVFASDVRVGP